MNDPTRDAQIVITLVQRDGKLAINTTMTKECEDTVCARVAMLMMECANERLSEITGQKLPIKKVPLQ